MRAVRDPRAQGPVITGLSADGFRIDETVLPALLLTAQRAQGWNPPPIADLDEDALREILDPAPEFILLGTGAALIRPPVSLTKQLEARGIGIEPMDSRAAARAWGVLRAERREIAGALYPLNA